MSTLKDLLKSELGEMLNDFDEGNLTKEETLTAIVELVEKIANSIE